MYVASTSFVNVIRCSLQNLQKFRTINKFVSITVFVCLCVNACIDFTNVVVNSQVFVCSFVCCI